MVVVALIVAVVARPAGAQFVVRSWLSWRTIETEHFALHYPPELEEWTRDIAERMESVDSAVSRAVGYHVPRKTHVVVDDPYATANGSAWPYINRPIVVMWASPPSPREDVGNYRAWGEMLATHEFAHIAHLTRPSRNPLIRRLWEALLVDLGPIALNAPRWIIEGYATYIEGRVTGSGRPHAAWRPALLRQWAIEGRIPTYDQLDASAAYSGGDFAYMFGSAYLEWLTRRNGDSSVVALWRRMTARRKRTFDEAFTGVFGESPRALYGRFAAELTAKAMEATRELTRAGLDTGTVVQRLAWSTGDPAISPDGKRAALVLRSATRPARLVVWGTAPEPDTLQSRRDSLLLEADPQDVPARPIFPPPKKALATLRAVAGLAYQGPRFLSDGRILVWRNTAVGDGSYRPDLYIWDPSTGRVGRVTRRAAILDADPAPDGRSAIATRCLGGRCDLVRVDLASGDVATIAAGTPRKSYYHPRVAPSGDRVAVAVQHENRWRIAIVDLQTGAERYVDPDDGANRYDAIFISATSIVVVSELGGIPNLERIDLTTAVARALTRVTGAAVAPAWNSADGSVWFLSLYSGGYDVRRIAPPATLTGGVVALSSALAPAVPVPARDSVLFARGPVGESQPYDLSTRLVRWIPAPQVDADGVGAMLAVASTDIVGRSEVLLRAAYGERAAWRGGSMSVVWRGSRPAVSVSAFGARQAPLARVVGPGIADALDSRLWGGSALLDMTMIGDEWQWRARGGATAAQLSHPAAASTGASLRALGFVDFAVNSQRRTDQWRGAGATAINLAMGRSDGLETARFTATASLFTTTVGFLPPLAVAAEFGAVNSGAAPFERFALGGLPSPLIEPVILTQRVAMPALPIGIDTGSSLFVYRVSVPLGALTPFWWSGSTTAPNGTFVRWHRVLGAEWTTSVPAVALAGTPAARAQVGFGYSLDPPLERVYRVFVGLTLNP